MYMRRIRFHHNTSLTLAALLLIVCYYLADVAMDALLFEEGSFIEQLLHPSPHEVAIRLLSSSFLLLFLLTTTTLLRKNRQLQNQILQQSQELVNAQRQLQDYNYAVSQQLRTTLTCISTAEQILSEQQQKVPQLDQALLESIHSSCDRMVDQIDHLENLSRARCDDLNKQQVSLDLLIREASSGLVLKRNDLSIEIQLEENVQASCDRDLMLIAIRNLIQGVMTFSHPAAHTTIVFGTEPDSLRNTYFVRNDGRHFRHDTLLEQFGNGNQEPLLDTENEDTSPLSLAKIIIARHGGKLWTPPQPGAEACFFFTL